MAVVAETTEEVVEEEDMVEMTEEVVVAMIAVEVRCPSTKARVRNRCCIPIVSLFMWCSLSHRYFHCTAVR